MLDRLPRLRVIFALLIGVPICWLVAWLIVAAFTHTPLSSASEVSGLLAGIGGIMGAIFTVGWLVIALVAVLPQLTLADQAQRLMEDKFNELAPEFEKRADQRINGRIAFRDAVSLRKAGWGWTSERRPLEYAEGPSPVCRRRPEISHYRSRTTPVALSLAGRGIRCLCQSHERVEKGLVEPASRPKEAVGLERIDRGDGTPLLDRRRADDRALGQALADEVARLRQNQVGLPQLLVLAGYRFVEVGERRLRVIRVGQRRQSAHIRGRDRAAQLVMPQREVVDLDPADAQHDAQDLQVSDLEREDGI